MRAKAGFTLLELVVGLVLTGVVALLVYGAAGVALDTEWRVRQRDVAARAELAWRAVVEDALRNLRSNTDYPRATLVVEPGPSGAGDRIRFITAGGTPPLTGDADWDVTIESAADGLTLLATPIGVDAPTRRLRAPAPFTGVDVQVLDERTGAAWLEQWSDRRLLPRALAVTFLANGAPRGAAVVLPVPGGSRP